MKYFRWSLVSPAVLLLLGVGLGPLFYALYMAFHRWNMLMPGASPIFTGLGNFGELLRDERFVASLLTTGKLLLLTVPFQLLLGLILALALSSLQRWRGPVLSFLLIPSMLAPMAVGIVWALLFSAKYGPINYVLRLLFNIPPFTWVSSPRWAIVPIAIASIWEWTPFVATLLLAGILSIPDELYDAAKVDGASSLQLLWHVMLPLIRPVILVAVIIQTIDLFKIFEVPFFITQGGPGTTTEVVSLYVYKVGFDFWNITYAAAMSLFILILVIVLVNVYLRLSRARIEA